METSFHSPCVLLLVYLLFAEPAVTSTSVSSMTSTVPLSPRFSAGDASGATVMIVSPSTVALPQFSSSVEQLPSAGKSSNAQSSSAGGNSNVAPSTLLPSGAGGVRFDAIFGAVLAVVVSLIVLSVFIAIVLITWRVRRSEKKAFTSEQSV